MGKDRDTGAAAFENQPIDAKLVSELMSALGPHLFFHFGVLYKPNYDHDFVIGRLYETQDKAEKQLLVALADIYKEIHVKTNGTPNSMPTLPLIKGKRVMANLYRKLEVVEFLPGATYRDSFHDEYTHGKDDGFVHGSKRKRD